MADNNPFDAVVSQDQSSGTNPFDSVVATPAPAEAPAANPFDQAVVEGDKRRQRQQFLETLKNSKDVVPERQAKAIEVAQLRGVPVGVAYKYLEDLAPKADTPDYDSMTHKAPVTTRLLADPVKGPVAMPDAQHLSDIEQNLAAFSVLRGLDKPPATVPLVDQVFGTGATFLTPEQQAAEQKTRIQSAAAAAQQAMDAQRQADLVAAQRQAEREQDPSYAYGGQNYNPASDLTRSTAADAERAAQGDLALQKSTAPTQSTPMAAANTAARNITQFGAGVLQGIGANADSVLSYTPLAKGLDQNGRSPLTQWAAELSPWLAGLFPEDKARAGDLTQRATGAVAGALPFMVGGLGAKAIGLAPGWSAAILGALQQAGQGEQDAIDHGASINTKNLTVWINDLLGATEALPIEALFATAGAGGPRTLTHFLTETASNAAVEATQNTGQQLLSDTWARLAYDPKRDVMGNAMEALKMGALVGGLFGAVSTLAGTASEWNHQRILALGEAAKKAKIAEHAPAILDQHIAELKKTGAAPEHVTAAPEAVETLFQELTPEDITQQFPKTAQALQEAKTTGAEVTIPTEELVRLGKLTGYGKFAADVRVGDDLTLNETVKLREDVAKYLTSQDTGQGGPSQEDSPIYQDLRQQLVKAGQSPEVATAQARLMDAFFQAQSERTGVPAQDLARRYGLEVSNSAVGEAAGQTVLAQGEAPSLAGIEQAAKAEGVSLAVAENKGVITLSKIAADVQGQGKGTRTMEALVRYADATGQRIALSPSSDFGGSKPRLMQFYKRFGFVENKGRSKDFSVSETMIREPQKTTLFQADAPSVEGQSSAAGNKHGFMPHLRVETGAEIPKGKKPLFAQVTMNSTAARQIAAIDEVLGRHPNATSSVEAWNAMMSDALASNDVPLPPYNFIKNLNGDGSRKLLEQLSPGQIADADHGFANAAAFRQAYIDGEISIEDTGRLFLWSFLSRGVSPYTQESLFIDSFAGIGEWINAAADGTLQDRLAEYEAWAKTAAPQGSGQPGAGATHNLNAFGKLFLLKMSEDAGDGTGRSRLQVLHDMMSDPNSTGRDIRRQFLRMGEGVGIDNKVVSFTLLVAGFTDVMVLDRVQIRELWNDGRFDGINLYDGYKVDGKPVAGSALSNLTYGARGLLIYEAIEQGLKAKVGELYAQLGRPEAASPGRYHWETWVASSNQEASHATIDAILAGAKGVAAPLEGVTAKEGEYGAYAYGARYGRDGEGKPYFLYSVPGRGDFKFSVEAFREFLGQIQVRANGIIPGKFKVTESGNGPWYNRPEVNLDKLAELAGRTGERYEAEQISAADAGRGIDPPVANRLAADQSGAPPTGDAQQQVAKEPPQGGSSASETTLNQKGPGDVRGSITFSPLRDKFRITLTQHANLSTFLHEGGHFFLEVLQDLVQRGEASAQQIADLKTLKRWMGIEDGKAVDRNGHEKFARGFETFLMEGKAPSLALHGIFQKFKAWMIFVYKRLANVRGDLNDEVRAVMDRLVASDAAIAEARAMVGWRGQPMSQEETGLTDAEYKAYVGEWTKANDAQSQDADARIMLEAARELKKTWTEERTKLTKQLEDELAQARGFKTWKLLEKGEGIADALAHIWPNKTELKIDPASVPKEWRADVRGMTANPVDGGLPIDMVAEALGFDTGEQMLQSIGGARLAQKAIPLQVKKVMMERHGAMDAAQLSQEAMKAVHNTPTMDVLFTEFRALAAKANLKVGKDTKRLIQAAAEERVAKLTARQLDPAKWRRAEVKAAEEAGKLAAKGRDSEAALAKRKQLTAAAMARASLEAQDRIEKIKDYLTTFTTNRRRAALGKAGEVYLDQVDQILEAIQFKNVSLKAITARQGLDEFVKEQEAKGEPVFISDETKALLGRKNYTELTFEELTGVHDAVKNLWTVAKEINTVRKGAEKLALANALADISKEAEELLPVIKRRDHLNPSRLDKLANTINRYAGSLYKAEFIFDWLGKSAHALMFQPIADAQFKAWQTHKTLTAPFMDKLRSMSKEQRQRWNTKRQFLTYPMPIKGSNIWTIALNLGNASNKEKLLAGYGWTESQVMAELSSFMTKEDWDLVQETWDTIEKMWPEISRVVQKATGLQPPKIEAQEIQTPFGTYRGGYFPVVYDTQIDARMDDLIDNSISPEQMFSKRFTAFVMNNGFTKGRTGNVGKLLLSPDIIADHLGEVIHYTTHYEAVKQVDRIMRSPEFKALVRGHLGDAVYSQLKQWLTDVATNTTQKKAWDYGDAMFRWARNSAQLTSLGFNIKSALKQPLGIVTTLDALKAKHFFAGIQTAWLSPNVVKNWKEAFAKSKELPQLVKNYDRDLAAMSKAYSDKLGNRLMEGTYTAAFTPIAVMQSVANVAAWYGGYYQALEQGMAEADAVNFADKIVRTTQGSGAMKDLAGAQRGGEATKFLTMFYSYFSVLYNRMADVQTRERGVKNLHRKVGRYAILLLLSELLNTLGDDAWQAMFGPDKKKEEDATPFFARLALNTVDSTINTLPGVRDLYTTVEALATHNQPRTPPGFNAIQKSIQGAMAIRDVIEGKDMTRAKARNVAALVGTVTHTPVYGVYRAIDDLLGATILRPDQ